MTAMKKLFRPVRFSVFYRIGSGQTRIVADGLRLDAAWRKVDDLNGIGDGKAWLMPY